MTPMRTGSPGGAFGMGPSQTYRLCVFQLGFGLGYEYVIATSDPPDSLFASQRHQNGQACDGKWTCQGAKSANGIRSGR